MTRLGWGKGKLEVYAHKAEILEKLSKGFSYKEIHHQLNSSQKITVGYRAFVRHAKTISGEVSVCAETSQT